MFRFGRNRYEFFGVLSDSQGFMIIRSERL
jgi:hypothetical protein